LKIFDCHKIDDQNPFLVTNRNGGNLSTTKDFPSSILTNTTNALRWMPTWHLMQNGHVMSVLTTLSPTFTTTRFNIPAQFCTYVSPIPRAICPITCSNHPLQDCMGLEMKKFFELYMKLLRKIRGQSLLLEVLDILRT
jgi:hypothetical protein